MRLAMTALEPDDVFVLRRLTPNRLFNLGGAGRGSGWAGNVAIDPVAEGWLMPALDGRVSRRRSGVPFRALGPYWATEVAAVSVDDAVVVFGGPGVAAAGDDTLRAEATVHARQVLGVTDVKLDADALEIEQAVASLLRPYTDVTAAAQSIATAAARALSCEFAAVVLWGPPVQLYLADEGWRPAATDEEIVAAIVPLASAARRHLICEQDTTTSAFPYRPLAFEDGLVARCAAPLGDGDIGTLVMAHTATAPRGFTSLCQRVATEMAGAAGNVLRSL